MSQRVWYLNAEAAPSLTSKCDTCRHSMQTTGPHGACTWCYAMPTPIQPVQPVATCSHYVDGRTPTLDELTSKAWTLITDDDSGEILGAAPPGVELDEIEDEPQQTNAIGFASPRVPEENGDDDVEDE